MFNLKKVPHHGSVENLIFTNVLGGVCRSRSEGQTEEDFRQEIFELIPATVATPFAISVENRFSIAPISNV